MSYHLGKKALSVISRHRIRVKNYDNQIGDESKIKMDNEFKPEKMSYYDERAREYDKIYIGEGPAIPEPDIYKNNVKKISDMASTFGKGHLTDIGCGTGFWLPYYGSNTSGYFFLDKITVSV